MWQKNGIWELCSTSAPRADVQACLNFDTRGKTFCRLSQAGQFHYHSKCDRLPSYQQKNHSNSKLTFLNSKIKSISGVKKEDHTIP